MRPADFTRIPPLPAERLAFREVVAVPRASTETLFSAVVVAPIVMFPPEEREMLVLAVRAAEVVMAPPEEVIDIAPAEEFIAAVLFVIAPEPESVMFPVAEIAPVGATLVPPLIVTTPFDAVSEAEPTYVVPGVIRIAAALTAPDPVSTEPELEIPTSPPAEIVCVVLEKDLDVPVEVIVTLPLVESMFELRSKVPPSIATLPDV
jgi:hypothetical protein